MLFLFHGLHSPNYFKTIRTSNFKSSTLQGSQTAKTRNRAAKQTDEGEIVFPVIQ
jgi:hypothetical protein